MRRHHRNRAHPSPLAETREEALVRRARRLRRRGEGRGAMLRLREACQLDDKNARLWTLYAARCLELRRRDDALHALRHAAWLRERCRDVDRARVTRALLEQIERGGDLTHVVLRAA